MSDQSDQTPHRFTITYTEDEVWTFGKLAARRLDPGPAWETYWFTIIGVILAVGLVPAGALWLGLISPLAFQPVLATAYLAFIAGGASFWAMMSVRGRAMTRTTYRDGRGRGPCDYSFDDAGVVCKTDDYETRIPWRGVKGVEDAGAFVVIWLRDHQAAGIPHRMFADAAARAKFVTSVAERIIAAAKQA
jgi:hypothetical protein